MLIKQFSETYNLTSDTVRYYEKEGLIKPKRLENGYRLYDETCEETIKFVLVLKNVGFTLQEIKVLISLEESPPSDVCNVQATTLFKEKISVLENKIEFYSTAIRALQLTFKLMEEGRYLENKSEIERLVREMYYKIEGGGE